MSVTNVSNTVGTVLHHKALPPLQLRMQTHADTCSKYTLKHTKCT